MSKIKTVLGIVNSKVRAEKVVGDLRRHGFSSTEISTVLCARRGAVRAGTAGLLAGPGALTVPGEEPFLAGGPLLAVLRGATDSGVTDALVGLGVPAPEAQSYEDNLERGNILIAVHVATTEEQGHARGVIEGAGAVEVSYAGEPNVPHGERRPPAAIL